MAGTKPMYLSEAEASSAINRIERDGRRAVGLYRRSCLQPARSSGDGVSPHSYRMCSTSQP